MKNRLPFALAMLTALLAFRAQPTVMLATSPSTNAAAPTYAADIAPLIYKNCSVCHRPGQSAPFSLLSYDDVKKRGEFIVKVTARRAMPPWHALTATGFEEFRDDRRLSDQELTMLKTWVEAGMPAGDMSKAPKAPTYESGWALGTPDLVLTLPNTINIPAEGADLYRNIVLPIDQADAKWITAIDFAPTARREVHHALFFTGAANMSSQIGDNDLLPGLNLGGGGRGGRRGGGSAAAATALDAAWGGVGGWVPGITPKFFPDGIAQPFPAHSNLVVQLHLHPSGKPQQERGQLAIYFAKTPPARSLTAVQVPPMFGYAAGIDIPAGESSYKIHDSYVLPVDVDAFGVRGHAHYLAREMKMVAKLPDGSTRGLLWINDWDFGWQDSYYYKTPFHLPKGTRIETDITYDNTPANPRQPNSPVKRVKWGRESFDEMGSMTLMASTMTANDGDALRTSMNQHFRQQLLVMMMGRGRGSRAPQ